MFNTSKKLIFKTHDFQNKCRSNVELYQTDFFLKHDSKSERVVQKIFIQQLEKKILEIC